MNRKGVLSGQLQPLQSMLMLMGRILKMRTVRGKRTVMDFNISQI